MKTLIILTLLSLSQHLSAQEGSDALPGPGRIGDCLDVDSIEIGPSSVWYCVVGRSLYERNHRESCIKKIFEVPFSVEGIDEEWVSSGKAVRLWSGGSLYLYDVKTGVLTEAVNSGFLGSFLFHDIATASGETGHYGCFGGGSETVDHEALDADQALPSLRDEVRPRERESKKSGMVINGVSTEDLIWALRSVNQQPHRAPDLLDLDLDQEDLRAYADRVASDRRALEGQEVAEEYDFIARFDNPSGPTGETIETYEALPRILDTLSPGVLRAALIARRDSWSSTNSSSNSVTLVNKVNDTLHIRFRTDGPDQPFSLPWTIEYGDEVVQTYSIELARLLMPLLPREGEWDERGEKVELLYAVAWYLGRESR